MKITITSQLKAYMQKKKKYGIIVEVASSDFSDLQVTELHPHFVSEKQAELFIKRKGFHLLNAETVPVLLPNYKLEYDADVTFSLKTVGPFGMVQMEGVRL